MTKHTNKLQLSNEEIKRAKLQFKLARAHLHDAQQAIKKGIEVLERCQGHTTDKS